jgi:uncharacterized protein
MITLGGIRFHPHISGALYAPDLETLLIADLHLEQGASLARRGVHVPPFDTAATLMMLGDVLEELEPLKLVLLGDSFHDVHGLQQIDSAQVRMLDQLTSRQVTIWLSGNHDTNLSIKSHKLGAITLRHEPSANSDGFEIAGHLHPGCTVIQRGVHLRGKCFVSDERRIILPAFGAYTGAFDVSHSAFNGLFAPTARAHMIGRLAIHKFPLSRLR